MPRKKSINISSERLETLKYFFKNQDEEYKKNSYDITNDPEFLEEKAKVDLENEINSWLEIVWEVISGKKVNFRILT